MLVRSFLVPVRSIPGSDISSEREQSGSKRTYLGESKARLGNRLMIYRNRRKRKYRPWKWFITKIESGLRPKPLKPLA